MNAVLDLAGARRTRSQLRAVRVSAPDYLVARTLERVVGVFDSYTETTSPVGAIFVAFNRRGIVAIERATDPGAFEADFARRFKRPVARATHAPADLLKRLGRRLRGERARLRFDLSSLTEFERAVLLATERIPHGEVRPYGWVAKEIGRPRAVRAVGSALAHNPIPLAIPCHRVVRSDGLIGDYSMGEGAETKRRVLRSEGVDPDELERLARAGVRYIGSDTTRVFCLPSCRDARRIMPTHRVAFHSAAESLARGYRPCRHCRPVTADAA